MIFFGTEARSKSHLINTRKTSSDASKKAAATDQFRNAMKNLGQDVAYLDQPEFKAFWDADARRVEDAVRQIGKVEG